jgi:hypothetical protein
LVLSGLAFQSLQAALPERSISPSRQFIIYGVDAPLRGAISELAESTKADLLRLLRQADAWKTPLIINLQFPQVNLPEMPAALLRFSQTGFGVKLQLDLTVARQLDVKLVERQLLRSILIEMIYRNQPDIAPGTRFSEPPDWLLDGLLALTCGRNRETLLEALLLPGKVMPLEKFLRQRCALLDSPSRLLYRAHAMVLVHLLSNGTERPAQLARYIASLAHASNNPLADLTAQFPTLGDDLENAWRSNLARLRTTQSHHLFTFAETSRQLDELLGRTGISEERYSRKSELLDRSRQRKIAPLKRIALDSLGQSFALLAARAHPVLRPLVEEYYQSVELLAADKDHTLSTRLNRLKATRGRISARMSEIDDYMNWFEVTQSKTSSGLFGNYLSTAQGKKDEEPGRRDALSVYLDALEEQIRD